MTPTPTHQRCGHLAFAREGFPCPHPTCWPGGVLQVVPLPEGPEEFWERLLYVPRGAPMFFGWRLVGEVAGYEATMTPPQVQRILANPATQDFALSKQPWRCAVCPRNSAPGWSHCGQHGGKDAPNGQGEESQVPTVSLGEDVRAAAPAVTLLPELSAMAAEAKKRIRERMAARDATQRVEPVMSVPVEPKPKKRGK